MDSPILARTCRLTAGCSQPGGSTLAIQSPAYVNLYLFNSIKILNHNYKFIFSTAVPTLGHTAESESKVSIVRQRLFALSYVINTFEICIYCICFTSQLLCGVGNVPDRCQMHHWVCVCIVIDMEVDSLAWRQLWVEPHRINDNNCKTYFKVSIRRDGGSCSRGQRNLKIYSNLQ